MKLVFVAVLGIVLCLSAEYSSAAGLQGCCSRHGGVAYCNTYSGNVVCNDGSSSPSCQCGSGRPDSTTRNNYNQDYSTYYNRSPNAANSAYFPQYSYRNPAPEPYEKSSLFFITVRGGYEIYYYFTDTTPEDEAFSELKLDLEPINLAFVEFDLSVPFFFFKSIYKYQHTENGSVQEDEKNQFLENNVDNDKMRFFLNVAAGFFGFEGGYSRQEFEIGEMKYFRSDKFPDSTNNTLARTRDIFVGSAFYSTYKEQADVKYHIFWYEIPQYGGYEKSESGTDFFLGYRYTEYKSPAIIYTYDRNEQLVGESWPQDITQYMHLAGFGINNSQKPVSLGLNFIMGFEMYVGYGYTFCNVNDLWYLKNAFPAGYAPSQNKKKLIEFVPVELGCNLGVVLCILDSYLVTKIKVEWSGEVYSNNPINQGQYDYSTGSIAYDYFQAVRFSAELMF